MFVFLCFRLLALACASSLRSDSSSFLSMQQQLQLISAGAAAAAHEKEISAGTDANELHVVPVGVVTNQPHIIAMAPHAEQKLSLLTIMGEFAGQKEGPHQATLAAVRPHPVDSVQNAQHKLKQKMSLDASRIDEQDMFAVKVMQKRKVVGCAAFSIAIAICFISAMSPNKKKQRADKAKKPAQPEEKPQQATAQQSVVSEVSDHLADLADLIGKLKMPSEDSSELAKQAMEISKSHKITMTAEASIPTVVS